MVAAQAQAPVALQGDNYGMPNHTNWFELPDTNNVTTTLAATSVPVTGVTSFRQVDTVRAWRYNQFISNVVIGTGGTLNQVSQYAPHIFTGSMLLSVNNLYTPIDIPTGGIDLAIFNAARPIRGNTGPNPRYSNPLAWPFSTSEVNLAIRPTAAATSNSPNAALTAPTAATSYVVAYDLPVSVYLDEYYDLDPVTGDPLAVGEGVEVTPLNMGLNGRDATPFITMNGVIGATTDITPFVETGTGAAFTSGQVLHDWRRIGSYNSKNPADMPPEYNWRYALCTRKYAIGAQSTVTIPLKSVINNQGGGQLLSLFVRLYDSAANGGTGAAISLGSYSATAQSFNVTRAQLIYGSNFTRYDDDPRTAEQRFFDIHNIQLPTGVLYWDLCESVNGRRTNKAALNLLTTDVSIVLTFSGAQTSTTYAVVGTESLVYVPQAITG